MDNVERVGRWHRVVDLADVTKIEARRHHEIPAKERLVLHDRDGALTNRSARRGTRRRRRVGRAATDRPHWLGGAPFVIPDLKTSDVEVDRWCLAPPRPFHEQVLFRQDDVAGDTGLPGARTAPDHREPVMR